MSGSIPPLPQYAFMAWCLVNHRDNFTFYKVYEGNHLESGHLKGNGGNGRIT
jgi:hypothetical protein